MPRSGEGVTSSKGTESLLCHLTTAAAEQPKRKNPESIQNNKKLQKMSETVETKNIKADSNEEPPNAPEVAETSGDMQAVAPVQEEIKPKIPSNVLIWLNDMLTEFEEELKIGRRNHEQIREELADIKDAHDELMLELENSEYNQNELLSKVNDIECRIKSLKELFDAANKRLSMIIIKISESILEVEKQADQESEVLKLLKNIQEQLENLEAKFQQY